MDADLERTGSSGRWLPFLVIGFTALMLASLVRGVFDPFFFGSDGRSVQGIDFFSTPKAFRNLLEDRSMYDSWGGAAYGPYSTWYLMHPAFAVFFASYLSVFSPWVSYWIFTFAALGILGCCGWLISSLTADVFEKRMAYVFFFCSFVTYWLLYVGNMHSITVLSLTLVLAGMYALAYQNDRGDLADAHRKIVAGLLISLFSKPVLVLALPVLLLNRQTRTRSLQCVGIYAVASLAFLLVPALNPESIGLRKMLAVATDPDFVRRNLDIYRNHFVLNEYMKDNIIHWLNLVAQSGASFNHVDIFSLSALVNSALGANVPGSVYRAPVYLVLLLSAGLLLVRDERERLRISLLLVVASTFSYFLSYNAVWEYQYSSLFPCVAVLFLMSRHGHLGRRVSLLVLALCVFYYLPSPYVLVRGSRLDVADINWIRSTKVIPSLICFVVLAGVIADGIRAGVLARGQREGASPAAL